MWRNSNKLNHCEKSMSEIETRKENSVSQIDMSKEDPLNDNFVNVSTVQIKKIK